MILLMVGWVGSLLQLVLVVMFLILLERKIMSYMSVRKGPKKVSVVGFYQSMADVLKLVLKEIDSNQTSKKNFFIYGPFGSLLIIVFCWVCVSVFYKSYFYIFSMVMIFCLSSFKIYILLVVSWGGNSKYSLLGGLRASAQVISYEISFFFILFCPLVLLGFYSVGVKLTSPVICFVFSVFIFFCWMIICLAETNRSPFDFAEGESELVSGFNVEYGALQFGFLYMGEYGSMMLLSYLTMLVFLNLHFLLSFCFVNTMIIVFMWSRASLPRFRYDLLMGFAWIGILPMVLLELLYLIMF